MKIYLFLLVGYLLLSVSGRSQSPTSAVLKEAYSVAARENKNVFGLFHASWCGWCHKMDAAMNDEPVKDFFTENYVIRHLVVYESKGKENLENPGALDLLKKYR